MSFPPNVGARAIPRRVLRPGVRRVARNALWLLFSQGGVRVISFLLGTVLARYFAAEGFGTYVFVMTYVLYFGILADAGLGRYLIRDVARDHDRAEEYLGQVAGLRVALACAAYALMLGLGLLTRYSPAMMGYIAIAGLSVFPGAISGALASMFNAREEMRVAAVFGLLSSLATALFVLLALIADTGLLGTFIAISAANLPPLGYLWLEWRRRGESLDLRVDPRFWTEALRQSLPYALLGIVGVIYFRIDSLMITWLKGPEANGIYAASYRLLDAVTDAPGVIVAATFPALARLHRGPRAELRRAYEAAVAMMTLLGLPVLVILVLFADPIITLLYGDAYAASAGVLRLLAPAVFLIFVDTANTMLLYSGDNLVTVLILSLATTGGSVLLNLILIPRYSYNGAAIATILATALSLLIFTPTVLRYLAREPASSS